MQMERCANAWKKERPGSQAAKELGERTQEPTMRGTRTPIQLPPSQGHFSVYPEPGLQGLGANYSLSVPTPMPVSAMTDYICGPPRPGSEPSLLAGRGCREGRVDDVWVRAGEERGRFQHRWRSLDFALQTSFDLRGRENGVHKQFFPPLSNPSWRPRLQTPVLLPARID